MTIGYKLLHMLEKKFTEMTQVAQSMTELFGIISSNKFSFRTSVIM